MVLLKITMSLTKSDVNQMQLDLLNKKFKLDHLIYLLVFLIGFSCGFITCLKFGNIASSCDVLVVSKSEIVGLERQRIKSAEGVFDVKDMFFGNQRGFLDLIFRYSKSLSNNRTKIVFINDDSGSVLGGENITNLVHEAVIKHYSKKGTRERANNNEEESRSGGESLGEVSND